MLNSVIKSIVINLLFNTIIMAKSIVTVITYEVYKIKYPSIYVLWWHNVNTYILC